MPEVRRARPARRPIEPDRPEKLALNLFDLTRLPAIIRETMLHGKLELDRAKVVKVDPERLDETGVILTCPLVMASVICDVLRSHDRKIGDYPTRVYLRRRVAWERLANDVMLTILIDGKAELNPKVFPNAVKVEVHRPEVKRMRFDA